MKPDLAEPVDNVAAADAGALVPRRAPPAGGGARLPRVAYWSVVATHCVVDVFPMVIISLMIVLQDRLALSRWQETMVWVATPIFSGLFQPLFAWIGDRYDTRLAGPVGLAVGAVCIGSIGFAGSFWQLLALQIIGVIGIGIYHPASAAVAGEMGSRALRHGRAFALSIFVASGMVGHTIGPIIATRINNSLGLSHLAWLIPPSVIMAIVLYAVLRKTPHRPHNHHELHVALGVAETRRRWYVAVLLSIQNSVRFTVNTALYILFSYWAAWRISGDPNAAAIVNGNLTAATTIGMGVGALLGGRLMRPGSEKLAFAATAFCGALFFGAINFAGMWGLSNLPPGVSMLPVYLASAMAAACFFSTIPASVGLGQRLLPSHAGLVTALLLGIGWAVGALARPVTSALLGGARLDQAHKLSSADFNRAFTGFAVLLAMAGMLALVMPSATIRNAARNA